jgi:glycosyltransferase involved in cell wall biosynthesis
MVLTEKALNIERYLMRDNEKVIAHNQDRLFNTPVEEQVSTPRVSVVIPTYNDSVFLSDAISSVLSQTFRDIEVIVVDDGSTDNTIEIVKSFQDPRIRYIYQENRGVAAARNTGILASRAEYIAWQDSDNVLFEDAIRKNVEFMDEHPEVGFSHGQFYTMDEIGRPLRRGRPRGPKKTFVRDGMEELSHLLLGDRTIGLFFMVRRVCFMKEGLFNTSLLMSEDWDIWIRLAKRYAVGHIAEPLARVRFHSHSMTAKSKIEVVRKAHTDVIESVFVDPELGPIYRPQKHKVYFGLYCLCAREAAFTGHKFSGLVFILKAVGTSPVMILNRKGLSLLMRSGKDFLPSPVRKLIVKTLMALRLR